MKPTKTTNNLKKNFFKRPEKSSRHLALNSNHSGAAGQVLRTARKNAEWILVDGIWDDYGFWFLDGEWIPDFPWEDDSFWNDRRVWSD